MTTNAPPQDNPSFTVHLRSLEQFAKELQARLDGLTRPLDRLSALSQHELPLGSFAEAYGLASHHRVLAEQTYGLLQAVRQAIGFASEVTRQVTASYQQFDQQAAAAYASGPVPAGAGSTVGPVPVSVQVSLAQPADVVVTGPGPAAVPAATVPSPPFTYADPATANLGG